MKLIKGDERMIKETSAWGVASLVLGILGLIMFLMPYFAMVFSILAIVFYGVQKKYKSTGCAMGGLVTGIVGVVINAVMLVMVVLVLSMTDMI